MKPEAPVTKQFIRWLALRPFKPLIFAADSNTVGTM